MKRNRVGLATVLVVVLAGLWGDSPVGAQGQCSASPPAMSRAVTYVSIASSPTAGTTESASPRRPKIHVGKGDQTITFTSTAPAGATVGGPTYTVTATASSGLVVAFTIDTTARSVCSISGSTVSFTAVGTCVIDANQAGNANYNPAPQVQQSFAVGS
jgi:hypothetical protein